ncbi:pq loop repeat [Lecanosticta acicola]|uniref:Pq loop repeat n=1 Tax=Lecanosticta acicola TaxID=111012 RepID=A0AAI8Z7W2_9PEZI|nr:pq loop repeat [Lecanosticta acicola]
MADSHDDGSSLAHFVLSQIGFSIPANLEEAMNLIKLAINNIAPIFIVTSPVTSYGDQIWSMNKNRSSAGFSLDIPLIMLVASTLKIFYWLGSRYDFPLLIQASVMVMVQILLLHIALIYRPPFGAQHSLNKPFAGVTEGDSYVSRPHNFWQWRSRKPYWHFLAYYTITLAALQVLIGSNELYVVIQGYVALSVEAILPIPQILENRRIRSCKGFRLSVLVNWLIGDVFKMTYFFLSDGGVPWAFKLCGLFQAACDCYLGVQYWMYGEGEPVVDVDMKETRLA